MLVRLETKGAVGCFLSPSHAAHVGVALQNMRVEQALVVIFPQLRDLAFMLHCQDFSDAIESNRLWFVAGDDWENQLTALFDRQPGLATPTQFIRTPDADPQQVEPVISAAQAIFSRVSSQRASEIQSLRRDFSPIKHQNPKLCVVAPSKFRLWCDIGHAMLRVFDGVEGYSISHFDADDPTCSAPVALLKATRESTAILTANTARSDLPGLLPESIPWITWTTTARIPNGAMAGCNDHLIIVDPILRELAQKSGWPTQRVHVGTYPQTIVQGKDAQSEKFISIISDTCALDTPKDLIEYSSHALLWEAIRQKLLNDPFALGGIGRFMAEQMSRLNVGEQSFPQARFIEKLIVPAYQQGVARQLIAEKVPLRLYGQGWDALEDFKPYAAGAIRSRDDLNAAVSTSAALVHAWPTNLAHPIDAIGLPVIRCSGKDRNTFLRDARSAHQGRLPAPSRSVPVLDAQLLLAILKAF